MEESIMEEGINKLPEMIRETYGFKEQDPSELSPLALAYIGDTVFDLIVRTKVVESAREPVRKLHKKATSIVNAKTQAAMVRESILPRLSEDEMKIFKRGRNAKSYTSSKNTGIIDYRTATGLEALIGWLYLSGKMYRITELVLPVIPGYEK